MKKEITINNVKFVLIRKRAYKSVYVYRGPNRFLRLGPAGIIDREVKLHRQLYAKGFPFAKIAAKGKIGHQSYFIENSLGNFHFGQIFGSDCELTGNISNKNFTVFLKVILRFVKAQISTLKADRNYNNFYTGIHLEDILNELPRLKTRTKQAIGRIKNKTDKLPFVLTHGDFGPFNIYPKGVIDIESFFEAPVGYDLVTAVYMTDFFPKKSGLELRKVFWFSEKQKVSYFKAMDKLLEKNDLPKISSFINEFILLRCIWTAARMQNWPKIQNWRYRQFKRLLSAYLSGKDLRENL
ncbi:MAG: hypothetical protein ABI643_04020 [Candidatus Doudnabacteria bacterium]